MTFGDILGLLFLVLLITLVALPFFRQARIQTKRLHALQALEKKRGSRVITLIHRQEALSFLGIPFYRYIDLEDSEQILRAIHLTPETTPIDLIIHTPGGLVLAAEQIAHALRVRPGKVSVIVPHLAMSGGTLIALAADEILMDANAVLGPVDPQLQTSGGSLPATSILAAVRQKEIADVDDITLIQSDVARKAIEQVKVFIRWLLSERLPLDRAERIASQLAGGSWTHDAPLTVEALQEIGLPVIIGLPEDVFALMELYPPPNLRRTSVQYIPLPYPKKEEKKS